MLASNTLQIQNEDARSLAFTALSVLRENCPCAMPPIVVLFPGPRHLDRKAKLVFRIRQSTNGAHSIKIAFT